MKMEANEPRVAKTNDRETIGLHSKSYNSGRVWKQLNISKKQLIRLQWKTLHRVPNNLRLFGRQSKLWFSFSFLTKKCVQVHFRRSSLQGVWEGVHVEFSPSKKEFLERNSFEGLMWKRTPYKEFSHFQYENHISRMVSKRKQVSASFQQGISHTSLSSWISKTTQRGVAKPLWISLVQRWTRSDLWLWVYGAFCNWVIFVVFRRLLPDREWWVRGLQAGRFRCPRIFSNFSESFGPISKMVEPFYSSFQALSLHKFHVQKFQL